MRRRSGIVVTRIAERYGRVADGFTERARAVPPEGWDLPAPPEGWVARDVVGHLTGWLPEFFLGRWPVEVEHGPTVDDDPLGAWLALDRTLRRALDDPGVATVERDAPMGRITFEAAVDMICTNDVLIHTWDLARATGLDERLDPVEVHDYLVGVQPLDEMLRVGGQYGPRVEVPDDADEQTQLLAFLGRRP